MFERHAIILPPRKRYVKSERDGGGISELPEDILSSIISYLNVREAVNASLLSRGWKHLVSSSVFNLGFDWDSMFQSHTSDRHLCGQYKDRFVRGVNQFLQSSYKGERLNSLRVSFCLGKDSAHDIDRWVSSAVSLGVERLHLCFSCTKNPAGAYRERMEQQNIYLFPHELLSSQENVPPPKLRHLFLRSCILKPGITYQFRGLTSLVLKTIPFAQDGVESLLSGCWNLESVVLQNCYLPCNLCISGSSVPTSLKFLAILRCWGLQKIELSSINLTSFEYAGGNMIDFSLSGVPNLKKVYLRANHEEKEFQYVFSQLAKDLPLVEALSVFLPRDWVEVLPKQMMPFSKVKKLEFFSSPKLNLHIQTIITILEACPLLESFYLVNWMDLSEQGMQGLPMHPESVHKHLKKVHISGFQFTRSNVEFGVYLLEYADALERMVLDPKCNYYVGADKWAGVWRHPTKGCPEVIARLMDHSKSSVIVKLEL